MSKNSTTVDVQDDDDGVSELGVSGAASASGPGASTSGTGVVTIDANSSTATATEGGSQSNISTIRTARNRAKSVWEFEMLERSGDNKVTGKWKCLWCTNEFKGWNATKALHHLLSTTKSNVKGCTGRIDNKAMSEYMAFHEKNKVWLKESVITQMLLMMEWTNHSKVLL